MRKPIADRFLFVVAVTAFSTFFPTAWSQTAATPTDVAAITSTNSAPASAVSTTSAPDNSSGTKDASTAALDLDDLHRGVAASFVTKGIAIGTQGDIKGAMADFDQAIKLDPNYAPAYLNRAYGDAVQGRYDDAMADYALAIKLDPQNAQPYYMRGLLKVSRGDLDNALADFQSAIKINPKFAEAYYGIGHILYFQDKLDDATTPLSQSISLQPNALFSYYIRGLVRYAQGDKTNALADFQQSEQLGYPYAALWVWVLQTANYQEGIANQNLEQAMNNPKLFPENHWPRPIGEFLLGRASEDDLLAAVKQYGNARTQATHLCEVWFYIGVWNHNQGNAAAAKDAFTMASKTGVQDSEEYVEANRNLAPPSP